MNQQRLAHIVSTRFQPGAYTHCQDVPYSVIQRGALGWELDYQGIFTSQAFSTVFGGVLFPTRQSALAALETWLEDEQ